MMQIAKSDDSHCWFVGLWDLMLLHCEAGVRYCLNRGLQNVAIDISEMKVLNAA